MRRRLFQYRLLRSDIADALRYTESVWGARKKAEYKELIREAKAFIRESPDAGKPRPDIHPAARVYRIAKPGRDAAHAFVYVVASEGHVILVRFLNEAMDLPRHFPNDYERNLTGV